MHTHTHPPRAGTPATSEKEKGGLLSLPGWRKPACNDQGPTLLFSSPRPQMVPTPGSPAHAGVCSSAAGNLAVLPEIQFFFTLALIMLGPRRLGFQASSGRKRSDFIVAPSERESTCQGCQEGLRDHSGPRATSSFLEEPLPPQREAASG